MDPELRILGSGQRAIVPETDSIISLQRQPRLTNLVLTAGIEQESTYGANGAPTPGYALFPDFPVDAYQFSYAKSDGAEMVPVDSSRGNRGEIRFVNQTQSEITAKLTRFTLAGLVDDDEMMNAANPWNPAMRAANLARSQQQLDLELKKAALVANTANYALVTTIATGAGWQTSGGNKMLGDVNFAAQTLENTLGVSRDKFELALFGNATYAASQSVELLSRTVFALGATTPVYEDVAKYLRIGSVWGANMLYLPSLGATPVKVYGDVAILYYPGNPARLRAGLGGRVWGQTFTLGPGAALTPYYEPRFTSWAYPWQKRELTAILDTGVAVLFQNPYGS